MFEPAPEPPSLEELLKRAEADKKEMEQRKEEPEKTPESHPADIFTGKIDYPGSKEQKAVSSMEAELPPFEADGENPEEDRISFVAPKNTSTLNEMDVLEESGEELPH